MEGWSIEKIKEGFEKFYKEYNRYPTAHEIDSYSYLPSSRQIQRKYGGLPKIRKALNLSGPSDFTKGPYSSQRARKIGARDNKFGQVVYKYLINHFGEGFVHRKYFFVDDKRTQTDFYIYYDKGTFSVDIFYPKDIKSLIGCINSKLKTYKSQIMLEYQVIFLMMNDDINDEEIKRALSQKKNPLHKNQHILKYKQFKEFCNSKNKLSVGD